MSGQVPERVARAPVTLRVHVPRVVRKRGGRRLVVAPAPIEGAHSSKPMQGDRLLTAIARAYRWRRLFEGGAYQSISELAAAEGVGRSYAGKVMRLMLLAPDIIEAILDRTEPEAMTLERLLVPFPVEWWRQKAGFPRQAKCFLRAKKDG